MVSRVLGKEYNIFLVADPLAVIGLNLVVPRANQSPGLGYQLILAMIEHKERFMPDPL